MRVRRIEKILALVAAVTLLSMGAAWADPQTKEQQKCINKLNKDGIKVQATQGKENTECVKRKNNNELGDSLTGTEAEDCISADAKGKVNKKQGKTTADDAKFCSGAGLPDFGYLGSGTVNPVTVQVEKDLLHDVFGGPPVDSGLYSKNPHVNEAVCQRNVINRVEKLIQTMGREFVKCKKNALKTKKEPFSANGAASSSDLHVCVEDAGTINSVAADTKGKIAKRQQNLLDTITTQCESTSVSAIAFPGECNGLTAGTLQQCLIDITECRFCQMINQMDGLSVDCDAFSGITCDVCTPGAATCSSLIGAWDQNLDQSSFDCADGYAAYVDLQGCACDETAIGSGCGAICDGDKNGTGTANFCNGVAALPQCATCLSDVCGNEMASCEDN